MIPAFDFFSYHLKYSNPLRGWVLFGAALLISPDRLPPGQPDMLEVPFFKAHFTHFFLSNDVQVYSTHPNLTPPWLRLRTSETIVKKLFKGQVKIGVDRWIFFFRLPLGQVVLSNLFLTLYCNNVILVVSSYKSTNKLL